VQLDYLKFEKGFIKKRWQDRLSIALVFPNSYQVGMANLGFLSIYQRLNAFEEIVCERVFLPEKPSLPVSIESKRPLKEFDIIIFSISFEVDYLNVVTLLKWSQIPLLPEERRELVLAGGVATWLNPLPILKFFDGILLGEWEAMEEVLISEFLKFSEKKNLLKELKEQPFFLCSEKRNTSVKVLKQKELKTPAFSRVISEKSSFVNTYLIEVSRGCGRGCRFCAAGFVYRPPRSYSYEALKQCIEQIPPFAKLGVIGLEFMEKETILNLGKELLKKKVTLTFSSLRLDALSREFLELFKTTRSIAIAPETGSLKLKKVINKCLTEEMIMEALKLFEEEGIKKVKLYFMLGLPFEEKEDIEETARFIQKLQNLKLKLKLVCSVSFFSPKPHTPFQWMPLYGLKELKKRGQFLKKLLKNPPWIKMDSPREAYLQALLARSTENAADVLASYTSDKMSLTNLLKDLEKTSILNPEEKEDFIFPWDFIKTGVKKTYLFEEWEKAKSGQLTPFCIPGKCKRCGAC